MRSLNNDVYHFLELIKELKECVVIVEGKRDENALRKWGIKHIITISGKPLSRIVISLFNSDIKKEVVILTDFDREGKRLASKLMKICNRYKIPVNRRLRREMMSYGKSRIEDFKI